MLFFLSSMSLRMSWLAFISFLKGVFKRLRWTTLLSVSLHSKCFKFKPCLCKSDPDLLQAVCVLTGRLGMNAVPLGFTFAGSPSKKPAACSLNQLFPLHCWDRTWFAHEWKKKMLFNVWYPESPRVCVTPAFGRGKREPERLWCEMILSKRADVAPPKWGGKLFRFFISICLTIGSLKPLRSEDL